MREILFRGKRKVCDEWVYGFPFISRKGEYKIKWYDGYYGSSKTSEIYTESIGQFTGLTDKNGKKIFEGDIVAQNWYDHDEPSDDSFGEVVFCEYDCSFSVMDIQKDGIVPLGRCHAYHWEAEVIGNIHDNPELWEVKDNEK